MADSQKQIVIVGAGIVGVSTAIWLQRAGHAVTLIDREGPAAGTSYGNAGILAAIAVVPVTIPGLLGKVPKMLLDKNSPLFMRWSYFPKLIPFLLKYLRHSNVKNVNEIADALTTLLQDTTDQHLSLAKGTGAEKYIVEGDYVFGYPDRAAYEADKFVWDIRKKRGFEIEEMDAERFAEYDPSMAGRFGFGVRCLNHGHITDPGAYVTALADHVEAQGGTFVKAEVVDIDLTDGRATGVVTTEAKIEADEIILATGMWSGPLAEKLGINLPMEAERGYHVEFVNPSVKPKCSVMVTSGKFGMTPMNGRLRCAGIVEFGGMSEERNRAALDLLKRQTLELIPELKYDRIDEWMGFRPSTSDSLPLIGATARCKNVWTGFGHQHIGLTAGPKTGRWLAQLINGQSPNVDLAPYSPLRFES